MRLDSNIGLVYISEQTSPEVNTVKNFDVYDKNGIFYVDFVSCLHSFDVMNRNSRMYKWPNIEQCLKTERIQHYLSHGGWFGEENHPTPRYKNMPLSPERIQDIDMSNTSHKMLDPHNEKNLLVSRIQSDAGTAAGMNLARKMVQGFIPGFSCRAIASMMLEGGKPVVNVRKIITYDWVLYQSHREAEQLTTEPTKFVKKEPTMVSEYADDVVIPLKEILENIGNTDVNAQIIMESFDLTNDDLVGFSPSKKHIIMRDNDNMIYCDIDPTSRNKLYDYLRSFG